MRVLVTGIDGFVGSHTAEFLCGREGVEVHGTVLPPGSAKHIAHLRERVHLHEADILDDGRMEQLLMHVRPDRVIHLAGQAFVPTSLSDPAGTFRVNVQGGVAVLEAARLLRERTGKHPALLVITTGEVYGRAEQGPVTEESPLHPLNPYAASKASLDLIAQTYRSSFGLQVTVARPFNHAGPRQSPVFVASDFGRQFARIAGGMEEPVLHVGNLDPRRDFTDVRDVVRAYWGILSLTDPGPVYNVCSGRVIAVRELVALYEEVTGIRVTIAAEPRRARSDEVSFIAGSFDRLRAATGWTPSIPLRQTLADVFAYWRTEVAASA
jgi:GDP-4-dehydro-6-deoxy-D-mannose reductase